MVFSVVVPATAFDAGDAAFHCVHARESGAAFAAGVEISSFEADALEREIVATGLVGDAQIAAGLAPLDAVRRDVPAAGTMLGEKVGEFMPQGSLNLERRDFNEFRIEGDRLGPPAGETCGGPQPGVPFDGDLLRTSGRAQKLVAEFFKKDITFEATRASLITVRRGIGKQAEVAKDGSSKVEHDELSLFHQAAIGWAWRSTTVFRARRQCSIWELEL